MDLESLLIPDLTRFDYERYEINDTGQAHLMVTLSSKETSARCPLCRTVTERIHSYYALE